MTALAGLVALGVKYHSQTKATVTDTQLMSKSQKELNAMYDATADAISDIVAQQKHMEAQGAKGTGTYAQLEREKKALWENIRMLEKYLGLKKNEVLINAGGNEVLKKQIQWKQAEHGLEVMRTDQAGYLNDKLAEQYQSYGQGQALMFQMAQEDSEYHRMRMEQKKAEMQIQEQLMLTSLSMAKQTGDILYEQGIMGFDAMRALAFSEAIINAKVAATKALAQGGIWGTVAAAAIYANAIARAYEIKNMKPPPRREMGGSVSSGQTYLVGERGPEMFTPNASGNITSNKDLGGSANITFNIQANDARGFDQLLQARRGLIIGMINKAMKQNAQSGIL